MLQIIYLGVQPTPYTQYFLQHLKRSDNISIQVFYCKKIVSDLPWKSELIEQDDTLFRKLWGVDWNIVKLAFRDRTSLFYVVGYNDPTKFLVMLIRGLLNYPYCYFTDSIKTNKNKFYILKRMVLPVLLNKVNAVLTTGEFGIKRFRSSGFCKKKTKVLNMPFFVPLPVLHNKAKVDDKVIFLCSGRLVERKGFDTVIDAFNICKEKYNAKFTLWIAGSGVQQQALSKLVEGYSLTKEVSFLGWLEPADMKAALLRSNVFIHFVPELDPFPVAVLEAMATGLPIIGSNKAGSVVERVKHGKSGFVIDSEDYEGLVQGIMSFINQPDLVEEMSIEARRTAEEWPVERAETIIKSI